MPPKSKNAGKQNDKDLDFSKKPDITGLELTVLDNHKIINECILDDQTMAFFGPRRCGKTTLIYWINYLKSLNGGIVMCPSPECYVTYKGFIPMAYIYQSFDSDRIRDIMSRKSRSAHEIQSKVEKEQARLILLGEERLKKLKADMLSNLAEYATKNNWTQEGIDMHHTRMMHEFKTEEAQNENQIRMAVDTYRLRLRHQEAMFLILDDLASGGHLGDPIIEEIFNNGRHYLLLLCVAVQDALKLPPRTRGGLDWSFIFFESNVLTLDMIYKKFASVLGSTKNLYRYLCYAQSRNCCLAVRKNHSNPTFENSVFLFPRKPIPMVPKMLGSPDYQRASDQFIDIDVLNKYRRRPVQESYSAKKKNRVVKTKDATADTKKKKSAIIEAESDQKDQKDYKNQKDYKGKNEMNDKKDMKDKRESKQFYSDEDSDSSPSLCKDADIKLDPKKMKKQLQLNLQEQAKGARKDARQRDKLYKNLAAKKS